MLAINTRTLVPATRRMQPAAADAERHWTHPVICHSMCAQDSALVRTVPPSKEPTESRLSSWKTDLRYHRSELPRGPMQIDPHGGGAHHG